MPYDLPFERIIKTDNESALKSSKLLARDLTIAFSEIYDLNTTDSGAHFLQFEIDLEDELPERYFSLWADVGEMHFGFQFWKDTLWLELGAAGIPTIRFAQVRRYANFISQHGFAISGISNPKPLTLEEGIEEHLQAYKEWVDFVEYVVQEAILPAPSSAPHTIRFG